MKILNGSDIALFVKERQAKQVRNLRQQWKVVPRLAVVQTIDNPVIDTYVRLKGRYAEDILVEFELHKVSSEEVLATIDALNGRDDVHGIHSYIVKADLTPRQVVARVKDALGITEE